MDEKFWEFFRELTDDEGLIVLAANSMSEPLEEAVPGACYIKTEAAAMILKRARELSGADLPDLPDGMEWGIDVFPDTC